MTVIELLHALYERSFWVNPDDTVDKIIIGNPDTIITHAMVSWISDMDSIADAIHSGCNLLITHEPTFWIHANELQSLHGKSFIRQQMAFEKQKLIADGALTILRIHDIWDRFPGVGIPYAWANALGFSSKPSAVSEQTFLHRYDIPQTTLGDLLNQFEERLKPMHANRLCYLGDRTQPVSKVGLGTGCFCSIDAMMEMGCDLAIVCDDGTRYWEDLCFATDLHFPVIVFNHAVSEEAGMLTLTEYLQQNFPQFDTVHHPYRCQLKTI